MFRSLLNAILLELCEFVRKHPDLLTQPKEAREKKLESIKVPTPFKSYLAEVSEKEFLNDLGRVVAFVREGQMNSIKKSLFFRAFVEFLTHSLAFRIDVMSTAYNMDQSHRDALAHKLITGENGIGEALRNLLLTYTYQELATAITELTQGVADAPFIVVQSPREMDLELKKEIREKLTQNHPLSFPVFQINRQLIGGFRVFINGEVIDHSWISRVLRFTSITSA